MKKDNQIQNPVIRQTVDLSIIEWSSRTVLFKTPQNLMRTKSGWHIQYLRALIVWCSPEGTRLSDEDHKLNWTALIFQTVYNFVIFTDVCSLSITAVHAALLPTVCFFLCPGCDAGSGLEVRCPEYGIFHPTGVAERHELTAVCHLIPLVTACCFSHTAIPSRAPLAPAEH